ncbi:MAG: HD domain-containing protein [Bradymonadia bacterium]
MAHLRDPIHGRIPVNSGELRVIDHRVYQRLRAIKQLGFTDLAFPGATHTRFVHSLGAMHLGGQMFDALFPEDDCPFDPLVRLRLRQTIRLSLMLHDVGHPPMSHAGESPMPLRSALDLECFSPEERGRRATHEDFTVLLLTCSSLSGLLEEAFGDFGITPRQVAHLISGRFPDEAPAFVVGGVDYFPILSQLVSGEMDADRMDYLQRDAHHTGVNYGRFDQDWLLENLCVHYADDNQAYLALRHRAIFAFEDFLLSRHHMFLSVYHHYIPVNFDHMLARYYAEDPNAFELPVDAEAYARVDDISLYSAIRRSQHEWARRIDGREVYHRLVELNDDEVADIEQMSEALESAGVECFTSHNTSAISAYFGRGDHGNRPLFAVNRAAGQAMPVNAYSKLYERYAQPTRLSRIYCRPEHTHAARDVVRPWLSGI